MSTELALIDLEAQTPPPPSNTQSTLVDNSQTSNIPNTSPTRAQSEFSVGDPSWWAEAQNCADNYGASCLTALPSCMLLDLFIIKI
jgi:hypothetical protein